MRCLGLELGGLAIDWESSIVELWPSSHPSWAFTRSHGWYPRTLGSSTVELWSIQLSVVRDAGVPRWNSSGREFSMRFMGPDLGGSPRLGEFHRGTLARPASAVCNSGVPLWNSSEREFSMRCQGLELGGRAYEWESSTVELSAIRRGRSLDATGGNRTSGAVPRWICMCLGLTLVGSPTIGKSSTVELWAIQLYVGRPVPHCGNLPCGSSACGAWALSLVGSPSIGKAPPWNFGPSSHPSCAFIRCHGW